MLPGEQSDVELYRTVASSAQLPVMIVHTSIGIEVSQSRKKIRGPYVGVVVDGSGVVVSLRTLDCGDQPQILINVTRFDRCLPDNRPANMPL